MIRTIIFIFVLLSISFAVKNKCLQQEKQKLFCTEEFFPVCGISKSYERITFSNRCSACSQEDIEFIVQGVCEDFPKNAIFCHPDEPFIDIACTKEFKPVCGQFDESKKCIKKPCANMFSNKCMACKQTDIKYVVPGGCE